MTQKARLIMKQLYVALGIDCDPDRKCYPKHIAWEGVERLPELLQCTDVKWTFNIRADTQIRDRCGSAGYCYQEFRKIWDAASAQGSALAWHLHYFDRAGRQDTSEDNILENIEIGSRALGKPDIVHMGWTFQNEFSIRHLAKAGVQIDYSPAPGMRFDGRGHVDAYDWSWFPPRPLIWHGVRMVPAHTFQHQLLSRRFGTERVLLTSTTVPFLFRSLLKDVFRSGSDYLVSYFHADELVPAVGGWRDSLYTPGALRANLRRLRDMAEQRGVQLTFVTIRDLARILFDERHARNS